MKPLRVSCRLLDGGIVSTDGLFPLDGILAAQWMRYYHPEAYYNDDAKNQLIEPELPLVRVEIGQQWIWAASVAQYQKQGEYVIYWHKRLDDGIIGDFIDKPCRVVTSSGAYKGYRMPLVVQLVSGLTWFCVGDPDGIRDLLSGCLALGKKRSQGFGMVALDDAGRPAWTVEEWPEDWSIYGPEGRLMRVLPVSDSFVLSPGKRFMRWGIRPPAWHIANQVLAEIPEVGMWNDAWR